jgi:predicted RNase H-like nuclease (RuvC/YqgF family)
MYGIDQLQRILGLSENQVRVRLDEFRSIIDPFIIRGARNKVFIDHNGLEVLKRAIEHEKSGKTLAEIKVLLKQELARGDGEEQLLNRTAIEVPSKLIEAYEERIEDLKRYIQTLEDQIREKDRQIERFQETIKSLPPSREEVEAKLRQAGAGRVSRWTRFKQLLKGE